MCFVTSVSNEEAHGGNMFSPRSKTWTFPNLKTPAPADVYLAVEEEEEEDVAFGSPFRAVGVVLSFVALL